MEFGALAAGVYDVVHVFADKIHIVELNEPPAPPSFQDTCPLGVVGALEVSVTVTVNGMAVPDTKDDEFGVMTTVGVSNGAIAREYVE
jgi:hypothetical protein